MRRRERFSDSDLIFLLFDTAQHGETFHHPCTVHKMKAISLPPHASNQLQVLNVSIFNMTKYVNRRINRFELANVQSSLILELI
jgi:hypothetical protein